jgi:general secretion pathway protein G
MFPRVAVVILVLLLLITVTIGVIAAVRLKRAEDIAKCQRVASDTSAYRTFLEEYHAMNGFFPTTHQGLRAIVEKPTSSPVPAGWRKLAGDVVSDPWGMPYIYRSPGIRHPDSYDFFSAGPDRKPDTADDVWRE